MQKYTHILPCEIVPGSRFSALLLFNSKSYPTLAIHRTVALQAPLSIGFPRQEYWSGLLFPSPWDLPDPGIESTSPALAGGFFTTELPGKPKCKLASMKITRK